MAEADPEAGIAVRRARDFCGIARALRVLIDDREVGSVDYGGREVFPLPPGVYSVCVAMDWCRSVPSEVHLRAGEVVELEGGLRWRGLAWRWSLAAMFFAPGWVFVVRPAPEPKADGWRAVWEGVGVAAGMGFVLYLLCRVLGG